VGVVNPFRAIATAFILTVGITPPTPEKERAAIIFVSVMLGGMLLLAGAVFVMFVRRI
jgi:hypothetical protein